MYCWGDDMSGWARPEAYAFTGDTAARKARKEAARTSAARGGRTYQTRRAPDLERVAPRGRLIQTQSANPIVVAVDVTGSMQHWPGEIFDRLPLLYQTLSQYRPDVELCFAAIGDATCDRYPLQVTQFASGLALEEELKALYGEGGGGGGARESYELFGYYLLEHFRAPNAARPYLILYGDEGFYDEVDPRQVLHFAGDPLPRPLDAREVWSAVAESWNVFHLRKPYAGQDELIRAQWADVLGAERVLPIHDEQRAVDLALGLIARGWGHYEDFEANMAARQDRKQVAEVTARLVGTEGLR